jgi:hypothetical protein
VSIHHILLSVLFFRDPDDPDTWIAQGLERDIVAHGADINLAKVAFERTVSGYIQMAARYQQTPLTSLKPAPDVFWDKWRSSLTGAHPRAERMPSIDAFMLSAVANDPIQAQH